VPQEETPQLPKPRADKQLHPELAWVNPIQIWAPGTVDVSRGEIRIKAYVV
jgi:hypothetical protein